MTTASAQVPELRVGIVGYGIMGKAHSYGYRVAPSLAPLPVAPRVTMISGRSSVAAHRAARDYGITAVTTDWHELVESADVDVVDICTPPGTHTEIAIAAAAAGKAVLCEKPLATSLAQAQAALDAVTRAGVHHAIGFNYRRLPAVALMKRMISAGSVGTVQSWRGSWLSDEFADPDVPFDWRFDRDMGGSTIADLGCHLVDLALWMVSPIAEVVAQSATFTSHRRDGAADREVTVDDASSALLQFESGAQGTLEVGRVSVGRPCDFTLEVNGSRGSLRFDYSRLNELWFSFVDDDPSMYGVRRIRAEHPTHPYADMWWPIGQGIGYGATFANQVVDLLRHWPDEPWSPGLDQGVRVQQVCDAIERAAKTRTWTPVT